ncbi:MAG: Propanediol utilization protein [Herbinix sp.]|jgi:putative phosphotransacetylase|nr:Propanediol utilization protein [Herbinix sp.]
MKNGRWMIEVCDSHIHLSKHDFRYLFGEKAKLGVKKTLTQPGTFIAKQTLLVEGPTGEKIVLPVYGPLRAKTQIELSTQEANRLGVDAVSQVSGKLGSGSVSLCAGEKSIVAEGCVIIPMNHLHIPPEYSAPYNLKNLNTVSVKMCDGNEIVIKDVVIRISHTYTEQLHISRQVAEQLGIHDGEECCLMK